MVRRWRGSFDFRLYKGDGAVEVGSWGLGFLVGLEQLQAMLLVLLCFRLLVRSVTYSPANIMVVIMGLVIVTRRVQTINDLAAKLKPTK